ncbi:MAG: oxygenase MpaB family protein, partial [Steroidobacteraceae bacterium]
MTAPVSRRINAERISLLAWSRAILLQLAHPLVAAGVAEHSSFREGRLTAVRRLHHTVGAMLSLTFGSDEDRGATLDRINGIHRRVNGTLRESAGPFAAGTRYSAEDPALLLWVHATLLDSIPLVYEQLIVPLTNTDRDQYCLEAEPVVQALGARDGAPRSWADLSSYMNRMYSSGEIVVSADARELAAVVLAPPFARLMAPATRVNWLFTVGLLPPGIREQYGFAWTPADERSLERWTAIIGGIRRRLPDAIALWPDSR